MKKILICCLVALSLTSCYSTRVFAPYDQHIQIASKEDQLPFKETTTQWYAIWGIVPAGRNSTDKIIKENGLTKVRIETKMRFVDILISAVTGLASFVTFTTIVEGEREKP